jgi:signal peptidase II
MGTPSSRRRRTTGISDTVWVMLQPFSRKARLFWPLAMTLLVADCASKTLAVQHLSPARVPHEVLGTWLRLTLTYNPDAAMGLTLGPYSRVGFALLASGALIVLYHFYRATPASGTGRALALALLMAGAAGNLLDRVRSSQGVIDFIDVGVGSLRFWTFNLADACITVGALGLAIVLWRGDSRI